KRRTTPQTGRDQWFPYYAGFSSEFARKLLASSSLPAGSSVLDPWNGSGTTTCSAVLNGYQAIGFDLNPVMSVIAKARLLTESEMVSVIPLLKDILKKAAISKHPTLENDPLHIWFGPDAAASLRHIERAIYRLLVPGTDNKSAADCIDEISCIAAFFYVAL